MGTDITIGEMKRKGFGFWIGWLGVAFVMLVSPMQLYKILTTGEIGGISIYTYIFLTLGLICYLIHAIHIRSIVFTVAQSTNLVPTVWVLILLLGR